jgi:putative oxidoreductase
MAAATRAGSPVGRALALVTRTEDAPTHVDLALAAVRVALVWIFTYYGCAKLFGWFGGGGIDGTADFMAHTAHLRPGTFFAVVGGVLELGAAIALLLGVASRLAALAIVGDMAMAVITVTGQNGIDSAKAASGYELNLALAALALVVVLAGPGRWSLDALASRRAAAP